MTTSLFAIAGALFLFFLYLQHLADVRAANYARKQQQLAEDRKNTLSDVLTSAHHQMSRELAALAFDLDDLAEVGADTSNALDTMNRLTESRDSIAVLAQLGQDKNWLNPTAVTAEEISPDNGVLRLSSRTVSPIVADRPLLRVALTSLSRHLSQYGFTDLEIVADGELLSLTARRVAPSPSIAKEAVGLDGLAERVLNAHGAVFDVNGDLLEWSLTARFTIEAIATIDLRSGTTATESLEPDEQIPV